MGWLAVDVGFNILNCGIPKMLEWRAMNDPVGGIFKGMVTIGAALQEVDFVGSISFCDADFTAVTSNQEFVVDDPSGGGSGCER